MKVSANKARAQAKLTAFQLEYVIIQQLFMFIMISEYLDYKRTPQGSTFFSFQRGDQSRDVRIHDPVDSFNSYKTYLPRNPCFKLFLLTMSYSPQASFAPHAWFTAIVPSHFFNLSGLVCPLCPLFPSLRDPPWTPLGRFSLLCPSKSKSTTKW